jgi:hypothetical protein
LPRRCRNCTAFGKGEPGTWRSVAVRPTRSLVSSPPTRG